MNVVKGKNFIISLEVDSVFYPVLCAKDGLISMEQEEIEVTNINSTTDREYEPGMSSYMMTLTGVTTLDNSNSRISAMYLIQQKATTHSMKATLTDDDGDIRVITFNAFLRTADLSRSVLGYSQSSIAMRLTGTPSFGEPVTVVPPDCEVEDTLYFTEGNGITVGATKVNSALLQQTGVEVLWVARTGDTQYVTTGTPGSQQYFEDLANGDIEFSPDIPLESGEWVAVGYKITA